LTSSSQALALPQPILRSRLLGAGGFIVFESLPDRLVWKGLRSEAANGVRQATLSVVLRSDNVEGRGGNPARCFLQTSGGEVQDAFYRSSQVANLLAELCCACVAPTGVRGTYSYYVRPDHHLALHRDIETCDVAVITCICAPPLGHQGGLCVYPGRMRERLSEIRANPRQGLVPVPLRAGETIVLLGGIVPHLVLPVRKGQARVVSVLCYRAIPT
jgi:hypothetical protein